MNLPDQHHLGAKDGPTKDKTAVALFSAYYPSHGGGMELACGELARGLLTMGMEIQWVAQVDGPLPHDLAEHCIPVTGTDMIYSLSGVPMPLPMPWALPTIFRTARSAKIVIVVEANFAISVVAFIVAKFLRKPILLIQHVGKPSTVSKFARIITLVGEKVATRPMLRIADVVVCVSPVVAQYFRNEPTKSELHVIGHGIDVKKFRMSNNVEERITDRSALGLRRDGKVACFVGRLTESKGLSVVAEMARLRQDWMFAIAGTGPVTPEHWGLHNVTALGQLDPIQLARLYRACDVLVLPSQSESFSFVVREALASGIGVICSDQILDTDPGLAPFITTERVNLNDTLATAFRFASALDRYTDASRKEARDYVASRCSWLAVVEQYARLIKTSLCDQRGVPR